MNEEEEEDTCSKGPHTEAQETATVTGVTGTEEAHIIQHTSPPIPTSVTEQEENSQGLSKKEKAQRKKDKKLQKARDQQEEKDKLRETLADLPSQREDELALLNQQLLLEGLEVKNVAADGHCLYRYAQLCTMYGVMHVSWPQLMSLTFSQYIILDLLV